MLPGSLDFRRNRARAVSKRLRRSPADTRFALRPREAALAQILEGRLRCRNNWHRRRRRRSRRHASASWSRATKAHSFLSAVGATISWRPRVSACAHGLRKLDVVADENGDLPAVQVKERAGIAGREIRALELIGKPQLAVMASDGAPSRRCRLPNYRPRRRPVPDSHRRSAVRRFRAMAAAAPARRRRPAASASCRTRSPTL